MPTGPDGRRSLQHNSWLFHPRVSEQTEVQLDFKVNSNGNVRIATVDVPFVPTPRRPFDRVTFHAMRRSTSMARIPPYAGPSWPACRSTIKEFAGTTG